MGHALPLDRRSLRVRGQVQGVGFRPFVYRLAHDLALSGRVLNDGQGVQIEIQGAREQLDAFVQRLTLEAPRLARIDAVESHWAEPHLDEKRFIIDASAAGPVATGVTPDTAPCAQCLAEMFDPLDRRWRYAFTNCTHCGPRYTITASLPYDRPSTSMARFTQCPACQREYDDPADRRFHAQPNACPVCGPRLALWDAHGHEIGGPDPVADTVARLRDGAIVALKGVGGFQLACDARNAAAVARLRARKAREEKPFAVMVANVASAAALAELDEASVELMAAPERPIVLAPGRASTTSDLPGVAPGLMMIGLMLPATPLHALLFHEAAGRPPGIAWLAERQPLALVMTSANPGGEPLVTDNAEAVVRLGAIADVLLVHDRDILVRCDDSVVRARHSAERSPVPAFIRRARGYTPAPIRLATSGPPTLAVGAFLKNTVCVTRGDEAFLSQHIGSLDNAPTCRALGEAVDHLCSVLEIEPAIVAHDLHPDFYSSRFAAQWARSHGAATRAIQHHAAHIAAVMAEHRLAGPVLGLALDGVGLGTDGAAWGGELLRVETCGCERIAHLRPLPLPGGDRAAREPWRMAAAILHELGRTCEIPARFDQPAAPTVAQMLRQDLHCPRTTSMGRWFDAVAGLLSVRAYQSFEGQAPMLLEGLAARRGHVHPLPAAYRIDNGQLDLLPLAERLLGTTDAALGAAQFHATLIEALADWCTRHAREMAIGTVVFGGGCFMNDLLARGLRLQLEAEGLAVVEAQQAPPNDGGLSLGQAWLAQQSLIAPLEH